MTRIDEQRGASLIEAVVAVAVMVILFGFMARTNDNMQDVTRVSTVHTRLHSTANQIMTNVVRDLKRTTFIQLGGKDFPHVFDDGVPSSDFASHAHDPAPSEAIVGDPDHGPNREIVFVLPADADADGRPDLSGKAVVWSTAEVSYTVVAGPAGNYLSRRVDGAGDQLIGRYVERIAFDTPASCGYSIPFGTVRVQIFLRLRDPSGELHRYQTETTVRLQPSSTG